MPKDIYVTECNSNWYIIESVCVCDREGCCVHS